MVTTLKALVMLQLSIAFGDDASCAYTAMGFIASPLDSCSVYSMKETAAMRYSSEYTYNEDSDSLQWNYYNDLNCKSVSKSYEMDDIMMGIHHMNVKTTGSGNNCDTVDIQVSGSYSELMDECMDMIESTDYYTKSFVINECIPSEKEQYSAKLLCDNQAIYLEFYSDCIDCISCKADQYIYEYYADKSNSCYSVSCNSRKTIIRPQSVSLTQSDTEFLKAFLVKSANNPILPKQVPPLPAVRTLPELSRLSNVSVWLYSLAISFAALLLCGICRYINSFKKEYVPI